ncbi:transposase domain-containing protein [Escherichia coli]|nr:transposase domain-containing protein [Escherichia coli]
MKVRYRIWWGAINKIKSSVIFVNTQPTTAIMSLLETARLNGLAPYQWLHSVLTRLPTRLTPASENCCLTRKITSAE